ncbi:MAG: HAD-IB family phosphatase [Candidatus Altiarchaeota archaeon]|nr:HAD-IB family phosphatase [Candidatus Altiarchaeota archaeon]
MEPRYKLVCFDVNVVLTQSHTIVDLADYVDKRKEVENYIRQHTTGQMNLSNALMEACKLLEGISKSEVEEYSWSLPLTKGINSMTKSLVDNGVALAMITTGFITTMNIINQRVDNAFKYIICNELVFDERGKATGGVRFSVMENESKADRLRELTRKEGLHLHQSAAVGDSAGDINMLDAAGLGIAFNPNKVLVDYATKNNMVVIKEMDLRKIVPYVLGHK